LVKFIEIVTILLLCIITHVGYRLKLNLDEEEREVEDKSRAMEERKRALDEDQISLEKFSKELAERREKLTKLEKGRPCTSILSCISLKYL